VIGFPFYSIFFISFLTLAHSNRWSSIDLLFKSAEWMPMVLTEWIFREWSSFFLMFLPGRELNSGLLELELEHDRWWRWYHFAVVTLKMALYYFYLSVIIFYQATYLYPHLIAALDHCTPASHVHKKACLPNHVNWLFSTILRCKIVQDNSISLSFKLSL